MAVEVYANQPSASVTAGGTTAPASGTVETWTGASWASFTAAATGASQFHIYDTAAGLSSELILVTNISGTSASVTRGAEGTTPVAHTTPFTVTQAITAGGLLQGRVVDWLNVVTAYGADPTGVADSTTAIGLAVTAAAAADVPVYIPAGTYKITAVLNWKIAGLRVIGAGSSLAIIQQATANTPVIQVAGQGQRISGLTLRYATQQTSGQTSAIGMEFGDDTAGSCFESIFEDLCFELVNCALAMNPAIATVAGLFSCLFNNIHILGYSYRAISLVGGNGVGAGATGCVFNNTYIHNNFTGSDTTSSSWPVYFQVWSEIVFNELNIEHAEVFSSDACVFAQCGNVVINGLHLEHLEMSGNPGYGLVGIGTGTGSVIINGLSVRFGTFTGTSYSSVLRVTGGSNQNVILNGMTFPAGDGGDSTPSLALVDFNSATGVKVQVAGIDATSTQLYTVNTINAGSGCMALIGPVAPLSGAAFTGPVTVSGGLVPASAGWTCWPTGGAVNLLNVSSGDDQTMVAGTWYVAACYIGCNCTLTGIIAAGNAASGTDLWTAALWGSAGGAALAYSSLSGIAAPVQSGGIGQKVAFPFSGGSGGTYSAKGPGLYFIGIQSNGTTNKLLCFINNLEGFATTSHTGTFGTVISLTAPTTYTANLGPFANTY